MYTIKCRVFFTAVGRKLYLGGDEKKIFSSGIIFLGYKSNFQKKVAKNIFEPQ